MVARHGGETGAFRERYPDLPPAHEHNGMDPGGRRSLEFFGHLERCRCGLLLPCGDCLPFDAATFQEMRMTSTSALAEIVGPGHYRSDYDDRKRHRPRSRASGKVNHAR